MTPSLPTPIARYFAGKNARDFDMAISGFAPTAVVRDEGGLHEAPAAIRAWMAATSARYDDHAEPRSLTADGDRAEVVAEVSGRFPGSPAALRFRFTLEGDRIVALEIGA